MAQPPDQQPTPTKKQGAEKTHATEPKPGANAARPEATGAKQHGATNAPAASKAQKTAATPKSAASTGTEPNVSGEPAASATPGAKQPAGQHRKGMKTPAANAKTSPNATPAMAASPNAAPPVSAASQSKGQANAAGAAKKKPEPQQVQQIKAQHTNFHAQPKPQQVPPVTFNQSYRIQGSEQWQGPQYEVFRSYHPERHDQGWYRSR